MFGENSKSMFPIAHDFLIAQFPFPFYLRQEILLLKTIISRWNTKNRLSKISSKGGFFIWKNQRTLAHKVVLERIGPSGKDYFRQYDFVHTDLIFFRIVDSEIIIWTKVVLVWKILFSAGKLKAHRNLKFLPRRQ